MSVFQKPSRPAPPSQVWARKFVIYGALGIPEVQVQNWRLTVTGLVEKRVEFTYDDLTGKMPNIKIVRDFCCVTQWAVADVEWEGVPFSEIAKTAGIKDGAEWVMFGCADGYTAPVTLEDAMVEDSIIALKMNGKPLSTQQGFPARPFIPHLYGWKSAKWLTGIELASDYVDGYWEMYGYHERGNIWQEERFKERSGVHMKRKAYAERA